MAELISEVADYYSCKLAEHGATPAGVDWNGAAGQELRFAQFAGLLPPDSPFSLNDLGCGYGALFDYLKGRYRDFCYTGYDVSVEMVVAAVAAHPHDHNARFQHAAAPEIPAEFGVASGIFNVRLHRPVSEWASYVRGVLDRLYETSSRGFGFNCLTSYSDRDRMRADLYYGNPLTYFHLCKRRYSRNVALLHDYGLYEFTILVRKVL